MKLLLIHQIFIGPNEAGGTRHFELARHFISQGHEVTIVASDLNYLSGSKVVAEEKLITEQNFDGVRVLRAYTYASFHRSFFWRVVSFLSFMVTSVWAALQAGPVDVVMGTSPPIFQAVSAWIVSAIRRRPFLLEIRDLWPEFPIDIGVLKNPLLIACSKWLEKFLYHRATHLLVNSPAYKEHIVKLGIPESRVSLIANGADVTMFDPQDQGERIRTDWNLQGKFVITYAGALGLSNDIPTVLRAANHLRHYQDIHFLLAGDGKERVNLEAEAKRLGLENITFTGALPKSQMKYLLAASDVCLAILIDIPGYRKTYPNKVFDYMAAGRPTILVIDGVIRKVIESAKAGIFVPPTDDRGLADAVIRLFNNQKQAHEMGQAARVHVCQYFNRQQQGTQFVELIQAMVAPTTSIPQGNLAERNV